jgi:thiol-disulfide isomerase/thioredoxin
MFWGSWCPPCRAEMPDIIAANAQLKEQGLVLLGVSVRESAFDAVAYAGKSKANFLVLSDPDETDTGGAYPLYNVPTHLFIDADGVIRSIVISDMDVETALREGRRVIGSSAGPSARQPGSLPATLGPPESQ